MKKILIVDGNSILYRSYYALNAIKEKFKVNNVYVHAVFQFMKMILGEKFKNNFDNVVVVFDKDKKYFRHDYYKEYKGKRQLKEMPEDLFIQLKIVKEFLDSINVTYLEKTNYEADDVAGSLIKYFKNTEINFLTSDKDYLQLVDKNIKVLLIKQSASNIIEYNIDNFKVLTKLENPLQIIDLKILSGDPSDNIPGIKGISDNTARILLSISNDINKIYLDTNQVSVELEKYKLENKKRINVKKIMNLLIDNKENILSRYEWLPIQKDLELELNKLKQVQYDKKDFVEFCKKYSMQSFIKNNQEIIEAKNKKIENINIIKKWDKNYNSKDNYIIMEYFSDDYHSYNPIGLSIINDKGKFYFAFEDFMKDESFKEFVENDSYKKYTYDLKAFRYVFKLANIHIKGIAYDLMLALYVLNIESKNPFSALLHSFPIKEFSQIKTKEEIFNKGIKLAIPEETILANWLIKKTIILKETYENIIKKLKNQNQYFLYYDIELPLAYVLCDMEFEGIKVNSSELRNQHKIINAKIHEVEKKIKLELKNTYSINKKYNLNSPKQISEILYNDLKILTWNRKNKGSSSYEVLSEKKDIKLVEYILEYRKLYKLFSTYIKGFKKYLTNENIIKTRYKQNYVVTGRLSSVSPNMQNIVSNNEIRKIFIPKKKDFSFISFDYSQIELRILAEFSKDKNLMESFQSNCDIHSMSASKIFDIPYGNETVEQRRIAKAMNFGIVYGITDYGLAQIIDRTENESKQFIHKYFSIHNGVKKYIDKTIKDCIKNKYVQNIFQRKRNIPNIESNIRKEKESAIRTAINMPIQSTAADILKIAMINIYKKFQEEKLISKLILQIHDELIFEVHNSEREKVIKIVSDLMIHIKEIKNWKVKLDIKLSEGKNLYYLK